MKVVAVHIETAAGRTAFGQRPHRADALTTRGSPLTVSGSALMLTGSPLGASGSHLMASGKPIRVINP